MGLTVVLLAILYRKGRELALETARSAARMHAMVSSSLDAILVIDHAGFIRDFNGAAETVFGYNKDAAVGMPVDRLLLDRQSRGVFAQLSKQASEGGLLNATAEGRVELEGIRQSGAIFPIELSLTATSSGEDVVFVSFLRDISDRYAVEEELRRARDDALAGERAKADLLTVMSHEMRTPLTGVLGAIDIMESEDPTDVQQKYLQAMRTSGELLLQHVNDVLELSRLEAGANQEEEKVFDLKELVENLVESQQATAKRTGNDLSVHCNLGKTTTVLGRGRATQQILLNLVGNALKFTDQGAVMVDATRDGDWVEFQVADTGKGIAPEHLEKIFDDFVTLDSSYGRMSDGTGLGLAITQRMVTSMDGEIACESEIGEGSTFVVRVPLPSVAQELGDEGAGTQAAKGPARLLIVEDNDINRELLQKMLELMGHDVQSAAGGAQAVSLAADHEFDLILMDISMPDVDGIEATRRIRARNLAPGTDIVALTAHAAADDHRRILNSGFAEILTKPVDKPQLMHVIEQRAGRTSAESDTAVESDIEQFLSALGPEKALTFLNGFQEEFATFLSDLQSTEHIPQTLRAEAHRLAGSASVLGLPKLRLCLLEIEHDSSVRPLACDHVERVWEQALEDLASSLEQTAAE